jgi:hypothetical protein
VLQEVLSWLLDYLLFIKEDSLSMPQHGEEQLLVDVPPNDYYSHGTQRNLSLIWMLN